MNFRGICSVPAQHSEKRFSHRCEVGVTTTQHFGEQPKVVSERPGHSNIQMTPNVYSYVTQDMQKEASDRFEESMKQLKNSL